MYRRSLGELEVFLVHPGGPFWAGKNKGAWTIPKGEPLEGEELLSAAQREFEEETGFAARGPFTKLGQITQAGGKIVSAWAFEGDCDPTQLESNVCEVEWPPRSNRFISIREIDRGAWFTLPEAHAHILRSQEPLLDMMSDI